MAEQAEIGQRGYEVGALGAAAVLALVKMKSQRLVGQWQPYTAINAKNIAAQWQQRDPKVRIYAPFQSVGAVHLFTPFAFEAYGKTDDILPPAMLRPSNVAITHKRNVIPFHTNDAVQHIELRSHLRQYDIVASERACDGCQHHAVALMLNEKAHAIPSHPKLCNATSIDEFLDLRDEHTIAQCKNLGTVHTRRIVE